MWTLVFTRCDTTLNLIDGKQHGRLREYVNWFMLKVFLHYGMKNNLQQKTPLITNLRVVGTRIYLYIRVSFIPSNPRFRNMEIKKEWHNMKCVFIEMHNLVNQARKKHTFQHSMELRYMLNLIQCTLLRSESHAQASFWPSSILLYSSLMKSWDSPARGQFWRSHYWV